MTKNTVSWFSVEGNKDDQSFSLARCLNPNEGLVEMMEDSLQGRSPTGFRPFAVLFAYQNRKSLSATF
jgi:hypothetical protein